MDSNIFQHSQWNQNNDNDTYNGMEIATGYVTLCALENQHFFNVCFGSKRCSKSSINGSFSIATLTGR